MIGPLENARLAAEARDLLDDPDARRGLVAMKLAKDLEACRALLRGEPVHPDRLDRRALDRLRRRGLWPN